MSICIYQPKVVFSYVVKLYKLVREFSADYLPQFVKVGNYFEENCNQQRLYFSTDRSEGIYSFCKDCALINRKYVFNSGNKISA